MPATSRAREATASPRRAPRSPRSTPPAARRLTGACGGSRSAARGRSSTCSMCTRLPAAGRRVARPAAAIGRRGVRADPRCDGSRGRRDQPPGDIRAERRRVALRPRSSRRRLSPNGGHEPRADRPHPPRAAAARRRGRRGYSSTSRPRPRVRRPGTVAGPTPFRWRWRMETSSACSRSRTASEPHRGRGQRVAAGFAGVHIGASRLRRHRARRRASRRRLPRPGARDPHAR